MSVLWAALLMLVCLLGAAFFSGIETGLVAINRLRLQHLVRRQIKGAAILQSFVQNPDRLLGTTLVGTNLCVTAASTLAVLVGERLLGPPGAVLATVIMTFVILVFAEYIPKAWFQSFPAMRSLPLASALHLARLILSPFSVPLMLAVRALVPMSARPEARETRVTRDEILHLVSEGRASGMLTPAEHKMIHEVIALQTKTCRQIMTPRDRMVFVKTTTAVRDLIELARKVEFNRYPVYDDDRKKFVGVVHVFDPLADPEAEKKTAADYMRTAQFVGDYLPVDHVLPRMRVTQQPMMLVTDDRFEVVGLVTQEDVLDEVVGAFDPAGADCHSSRQKARGSNGAG
jgi:putative hemolysin